MSYGAAFFLDADGSLWAGEERALGEGENGMIARRFEPARAAAAPWEDFAEGASWSLRFTPFAPGSVPPLAKPAAAATENRGEWNELCRRGAEALRGETLGKLVLARAAEIPLTPEEHAALLEGAAARLLSAEAPRTYRFWLSRGKSVFFGATPELLFRREEGEIFVPAIAGTRPIAPGAEEELLGNEKERREHDYVVQGILENLRRLGLSPAAAAAPEILRVPGLLHLYTPIRAADSGELSSEELLAALHPTPAIAGYPQGAARDFLRAHEGERGLYAAPLLVDLPGRTLCLVAIRSALLRPDSLRFFAGAGFVAGSTAEGEWRETGKKMQALQSILFGEST